MYEIEIMQIFETLDNMERNLDAPPEIFAIMRDDLDNALFAECSCYGNFTPNEILSIYMDDMGEFSLMAPNDEKKKLYYHGCDCSKTAFWADKQTGCSKNFWLRSIGWFTVTLADIIGYINNDSDRKELIGLFREIIDGIAQYADPQTGMYYQVVDCGGREGNYLETSGSSMIAYAMMKGARLGVLDSKYSDIGHRTFDGICNKYLKISENGELALGGICLVAGLGPENNRRRDGTYEYYISEPVVENDAKGVAPFLLCYTEVMRRVQQK